MTSIERLGQAVNMLRDAIAALSQDDLEDVEVQRSLKGIAELMSVRAPIRKRKRPRNQQSPGVCRGAVKPATAFCRNKTPAIQRRFLNAADNVLEARWGKPQQYLEMWKSTAELFSRAQTPACTLLKGYDKLSCVQKPLSAVLTVLIAHEIDIEIEAAQDDREYARVIRRLSSTTGVGEDTLKRWELQGRWLTHFCERAKLGALFLLGDTFSSFGVHMTSSLVGPFADFCDGVEGFKLHAQKLTPVVCKGIRDGAELYGGEISLESRLGQLLAGPGQELDVPQATGSQVIPADNGIIQPIGQTEDGASEIVPGDIVWPTEFQLDMPFSQHELWHNTWSFEWDIQGTRPLSDQTCS